MIKYIKKTLTNKFDMEKLNVVDVILGIKNSKIYDRLVLFQSHFLRKFLIDFLKLSIKLSKYQWIKVYIYKKKKKQRWGNASIEIFLNNWKFDLCYELNMTKYYIFS